jgi:hypothetical protein
MAKRSKRKRRGPKPRVAGPAKDRVAAELEAALHADRNPHLQGPGSVLFADQPNPPRVKGHVTRASKSAILDQ